MVDYKKEKREEFIDLREYIAEQKKVDYAILNYRCMNKGIGRTALNRMLQTLIDVHLITVDNWENIKAGKTNEGAVVWSSAKNEESKNKQ
jgi:hypothetical protein